MLILMANKVVLLYLLIFFSCGIHQQANCWHGIIPLRSTRADVERVLGPPTPDSKAQYAAEYRTDKERVLILYSTGTCDAEDYGWNIPRDTVVRISVEPKVKPKIADLKLDDSKYEKVRDPEVLFITYYTNKEDGISIEVNTDKGVVNTFRYSPMSKDNHLRCPKSSQTP